MNELGGDDDQGFLTVTVRKNKNSPVKPSVCIAYKMNIRKVLIELFQKLLTYLQKIT